MAFIVHLNPKGCMGLEAKCRRSAFEGASLISCFSPDKAGDIAKRAGLLSQAYPRLSQESKKVLLHPHIFPLFLGVKDTYIKYDGDPELEDFGNELGRTPEIRENYPLILMDHYAVDFKAFQSKMAETGHLIAPLAQMSQEDVDYYAHGRFRDIKWRTKLRDTLEERYILFTEERTALHGFMMGYPLADIKYCLGIERLGYPLDARIITNYFGNEMLSDHNKTSEKLLIGWETAMKYGYGLLSKSPDFWECFIPALENAVSWLSPRRVVFKPFHLTSGENWN